MTNDNAITMVTAAIGYAWKYGWPVFPINATTKKPLTKHGFKDATRDRRLISEWWRQWPDAGLAIAVPSGFLVVDVDPRNGGALPPGLPVTKTAGTRSGGAHYYYRVPPGLHFVGQWPGTKGVDIKAAGKGYVIVPPTPGYSWNPLVTGEVVWLPDPVWEGLVRQGSRSTMSHTSGPPRYLPWEDGTPYGLTALLNATAAIETAENGQRNNVLFKKTAAISGLIAGGELEADAALEALHKAAIKAGLEDDEVLHTLESAFARGVADPRRAP